MMMIFVMVKCTVFFNVRTEFFNIISTSFGYRGLNYSEFRLVPRLRMPGATPPFPLTSWWHDAKLRTWVTLYVPFTTQPPVANSIIARVFFLYLSRIGSSGIYRLTIFGSWHLVDRRRPTPVPNTVRNTGHVFSSYPERVKVLPPEVIHDWCFELSRNPPPLWNTVITVLAKIN
jgi:hypothetical protein